MQRSCKRIAMKKTITDIHSDDPVKAVKKLARERIGQPGKTRVIVPKKGRKAKHKEEVENVTL
jgi:hypothetical protein